VPVINNQTVSRNYSVEELVAEVERLRNENAILQAELAQQKQTTGRGPLFKRRLLVWIFILLACASAILAPIAFWARSTFLDTNNFVNIVAPLTADETVARALSNEVASRFFVQLEIQKRVKEALQEALPDKLDFLARPIGNSLQAFTQNITYEVITSPEFQAAWNHILRLAHSAAVAIIRGDRLLPISGSGEVVLEAADLMLNVRGRLVAAGLRFLEKAPIPPDVGKVVLLASSQLRLIRERLQVLETLNWLLPFLAIAFFAAAVLISEDRRESLMWMSIALAVAMMLSLMLLNLVEGELLREVRNPANVGAVSVIFEKLTANLVRMNVGLLILGIVGAGAFALAGPYAWATRARHKAGDFLADHLTRPTRRLNQ
jgi:flagellar basal body-associated protein FliL